MLTARRHKLINNQALFFSKSMRGLLLFCLSILLIFPKIASAQDLSLGLELAGSTGLASTDLRGVVIAIIRVIFGFLGLIAFVLVLYAGYLWQTSKGDSKQIETAKSILKNAAIGLAIILSAYGITEFIISRIVGAVNGGNGGAPIRQVNYNGGSLGGGILQMVYPAPGANNVPRNTMIMVAFKQPIDRTTVIDTDTSGCPATIPPGAGCGHVKKIGDSPVINIINDKNESVPASDVLVTVSADNKQFVVDPQPLLGLADSNVEYKVVLSETIKKTDGKPAFYTGGYRWNFTTSTLIDSESPTVVSVQPKINASAIAANGIVQINFSEAVNAIAAAGIVQVSNGTITTGSWRNAYVKIKADNKVLGGQWEISNGFKTIEFIPETPCAMPPGQTTNSCGKVPYCLPTLSELNVLAKAALTDVTGATIDLLSGINDAAGNSLDGGANNGLRKDGKANGRPADDQDQFVDLPTNDNFFWTVTTGSEIDLTPPMIITGGLAPVPAAKGVPRNESPKATFSESLRSSTVNGDNASLFKFDCLLPDPSLANELPTDPLCFPASGFGVSVENDTTLAFSTFNSNLDGLTIYNTRLTGQIQDLYQNCFNPAAGPCESLGTVNPYCGFNHQPVGEGSLTGGSSENVDGTSGQSGGLSGTSEALNADASEVVGETGKNSKVENVTPKK
jgi:hypothetical protein